MMSDQLLYNIEVGKLIVASLAIVVLGLTVTHVASVVGQCVCYSRLDRLKSEKEKDGRAESSAIGSVK
jgi:hypothetical protein